MKDYSIIIPAGGKGSRLYPLTKNVPKPYLPLYYKEQEIIRLIDLPLTYAKNHNIETFIAIDYLKEKLLYLKEKYQTNIIETHYELLSDAILELLNQISDDKAYSVYAPDFLIPTTIIDEMLKLKNKDTETIALCSKNNDYSKIKIKLKDGHLSYEDGEEITDLTFHIGNVKKAKEIFENLNDITDIWKKSHPIDSDLTKAKIYISDIEHIDIGTPSTYYEVVKKLNNQDENGNIIFPGAKINNQSKNIIALPNSNSTNIILENCIIPEDTEVTSYCDVLNVTEEKEKFGKIKIKEYIKE